MVEDNEKHVDHPDHYTKGGDTYEAINIIEAWGLNFCLGNVIKYVLRAGYKNKQLQDLEKAKWYLEREIDRVKNNKEMI